MTIYSNNDVEITIDKVDSNESKVCVNNEPLIWILSGEKENFSKELKQLLDKYRI